MGLTRLIELEEQQLPRTSMDYMQKQRISQNTELAPAGGSYGTPSAHLAAATEPTRIPAVAPNLPELDVADTMATMRTRSSTAHRDGDGVASESVGKII